MEAPEIPWESLFVDIGPLSHPQQVCKTQINTQASECFLSFWRSLIREIDPARLPALQYLNNSQFLMSYSSEIDQYLPTFDKLETEGQKHPQPDLIKGKRLGEKNCWTFIYLQPKAEPKTLRQGPVMPCRRTGHPDGCQTEPSAIVALPDGSVSFLGDIKQGEVASYQHNQYFISWHSLKGSTEIAAAAFSC